MDDGIGPNQEKGIHYEHGVAIFETKLEKIEREQVDAKERDKRYRDEQLTINQQQLRVNRRLMLFTGFLLLTSLLSGGIAIYQSGIAKSSAEAARDSARTTNLSFDASMDEFDRTITQTLYQTSAQMKSAQAAKDAIEQARNQLRLDQRAWLVATAASIGDIEDGKPIDFGFVGTNTGKTPGRKVVIQTHVTFSPSEVQSESDLVKEAQNPQPSSIGLVAPNATFGPSADCVPAALVPLVKAKLGTDGCSYSWGDVHYEDIFKEKHSSEYCSYRCMKSAAKQLVWCKFHNEAN